MAKLRYADLIAEAAKEEAEKSLVFECKDGKEVRLRPILLLNSEELKTAQTLIKVIADEKADTFDRLAAIDNILIAAADKKNDFKKALADIPPTMRTKIFDEWMKAGQLGEASA